MRRRRILTEEHKENIRKAMLGKKHSEETRKKISLGHMVKVMCVETGIVYRSIEEAAIAAGRGRQTLFRALDKPEYTSAGYHWVRA